ncbi:hypothetical protein BV22DRAFT_1073258 [Leucogyrophana mollusca]|uniref:Uncharacterized protein n=1 Tax=Leucogyrophana mollusca TaxID=85980 RepID=A0ACB8B6P6_9AGAM|nr:hypothetical protein BV22DRAFT_1073258 [Leucogyrophana mollusca]
MNPPSGIVHHSPDQQQLVHLPLERVLVKAWIVDVSARISLTQVFNNASETPTGRAKYVFPLPARAAVCAFELELANGRIITGIAKEKAEAAQTFEQAIETGRAAGLVEYVTDDIFTISVGSIPPRQTVIARLIFVMDLFDDGIRDHVRLQLPMAIAQRYGPEPPAMANAKRASSNTHLDIQVDIQMSDIIHDIRSSTHPSISLLRYKTRAGRKSQRRMSAIYTSPTFLDSDFVLSVHASGLDDPRCFAEVDPLGSGTIAMRLMLVPKFKMPRVASQEFIFVIDRSGSMGGPRIETAKKTLTMLLRLLPDANTTFNIFSFGSRVEGLWPRSALFNQASMMQASAHVRGMDADFGGTEITMALQHALNSRDHGRPTVTFVLTDGEVYVDAVTDPFAVVRHAVAASTPHAPLRVFTLGIGTQVSTDMCERLAREGNGECLFAVSAQSITGKCARLLNAGRTKVIENVVVDWRGTRRGSVSFSRPGTNVDLQQAPHKITKIYPFMRFVVSVITSLDAVPSEVVLKAKVEGVDEELELVVPVTEVKPFKDAGSGLAMPLVHILTARNLITELEEDRTPLPAITDTASGEEHKKAAVVRLGVDYQLVSKYTSFVAVESGNEHVRRGNRNNGNNAWANRRRTHSPGNRGITASADTQGGTGIAFVDDLIDGLSQMVSTLFGFGSSQPSGRPRAGPIPGSFPEASSNPGASSTPSESIYSHENRSVDSYSTMSSLEGSSTSSRWSRSRSPSPVRRFDPVARSPSPVIDVQPPHARRTNDPSQPPIDQPSHSIPAQAYAIFELQKFDGSFAPSDISGIVDTAVLQKAGELGVDEVVWATILAFVYLQTYLGESEPDLLDCLLGKATEFIEGHGERGRGFNELVMLAQGYVGPVQ